MIWKYLINIKKYLKNQASLISEGEISRKKVLAPHQSIITIAISSLGWMYQTYSPPWLDCLHNLNINNLADICS